MPSHTEDELRRKLPELPDQIEDRVDTTLISLEAPDLVNSGTQAGFWGTEAVAVPDPTVDLTEKQWSFRKVNDLSVSEEVYIKKLNQSLRGGASIPILKGALGLVVGAAGTAIGVAWTATTVGLSLAISTLPVQARVEDELWQIERVGTYEHDLKHTTYSCLLDPIRAKHGKENTPACWILGEERSDLVVT